MNEIEGVDWLVTVTYPREMAQHGQDTCCTWHVNRCKLTPGAENADFRCDTFTFDRIHAANEFLKKTVAELDVHCDQGKGKSYRVQLRMILDGVIGGKYEPGKPICTPA